MTQRPSDRPAAHGSRTTTVEHTPEIDAGPSRGSSLPPSVVGVLKLRGAPLKKQRVVWSEETVDNEGMGKKKSKSKKVIEVLERPLIISLLYLPQTPSV